MSWTVCGNFGFITWRMFKWAYHSHLLKIPIPFLRLGRKRGTEKAYQQTSRKWRLPIGGEASHTTTCDQSYSTPRE